ncbi:MAG: tetratricopeptide repeat protein, partial [candidate division WOR-3 bacterium]
RLKGKTETVIPYEIIGKKLSAQLGLSALHSDLIGRDNELDRLKQGFHDLREKRSTIFVIKGEIGVGKSRLLYELKKYLSLAAPQLVTVDIRGISYESSIAYKAFSDGLKNALIPTEGRSSDVLEKSLREKAPAYLGDEAEETIPYLYKLFNIPLNAAEMEKVKHLDSHSLQIQILLAVTTLIEKITEHSPLVLIIDDTQWLDTTSLELINFLLPLVKRNRISIYLCYRPGDISSIQFLVDALNREYNELVSELTLTNLNSAQSDRMIINLVGKELGKQVKEYIIQKSEGNPFFIEEIVRNILNSDMHVPANVSEIQLPGSIEAAVSSRIDSLSQEIKHLLRIAAIIGRSFSQDLLEEVVKDKEMYQYIDVLEQLEFLLKTVKDNKVHYTFRHSIFQEVTYNSLLKSERTKYHKVIAGVIETKFQSSIDGHLAILAHHYHNADIPDKALEYAIKAGDEAAGLFANEEALILYRQGLSISTEGHEKARLLEKIGEIEARLGRCNQALTCFHEAEQQFIDKLDKARIAGKIAELIINTGKVDDGIESLKKTMSSIRQHDTDVLADIQYHLAHTLLEFKADTEKSYELTEDIIRIGKKIGDRVIEANGLRLKGQILFRKEQNEVALSVLQECKTLYETLDQKNKLSAINMLIAAVYRSLGKLHVAIDHMKQAYNISKEIGDQRMLGNAFNNLGVYYGLLGDNNTAIDYYKKYLENKRRIGDKRGEGIALFNIGVLNDDIGEFEAGLKYFKKAQALFEKINDIRGMIHVYPTIAHKLLLQGREKEAAMYLGKGMSLAKETNDPFTESIVNIYQAGYLIDKGRFDDAFKLLESARALAEDTAHKHLMFDVYTTLAVLFIEQSDDRAIPYAEKGLASAVETKVKRNEIHALRILGRAQALVAGNFDAGITNIKHSIAIAREFNLQAKIADGLLALGEAFLAEKKMKEASKYLQQAKDIYQKANITVLLKKTKDLIKSIG